MDKTAVEGMIPTTKSVDQMTVAELSATLERRRMSGRQKALRDIAEKVEAVKKLVKEAEAIAESFQLEFTIEFSSDSYNFNRERGWNSSSRRC